MFHLYLPIAGNSVNVLLIFGLGGLVGILSGIFGVGGGFLMTPLLIMFGIPPTIPPIKSKIPILKSTLPIL